MVPERVSQVVDAELRSLVLDFKEMLQVKEPEEFEKALDKFLAIYSGRFTWVLPAIVPTDKEVDDYLDNLAKVYSAV